MCGRFVATTSPEVLASYFDAAPPPEPGRGPRYNVAPSTEVFVVLEDGGVRKIEPRRWGLVPRWAKDPAIGNRMINARAETLAEKNSFKSAFRSRRCIVPADGFYEWHKVPGQRTKQPIYLHSTDGAPLAFAGLWERWRPKDAPDGDVVQTTTIVTTEANADVEPVHDRMPVILPATTWDAWLDEDNDDLEALGQLLVPASSGLLTLHEVSTEVNNVRNQGAHLIDRAQLPT